MWKNAAETGRFKYPPRPKRLYRREKGPKDLRRPLTILYHELRD